MSNPHHSSVEESTDSTAAAPPYTASVTDSDNTPTTAVPQEGEPTPIVLDTLIKTLEELAEAQRLFQLPRTDTEQYDYNCRLLTGRPADSPNTEALPAYNRYSSSYGPRPTPPEDRESILFERITDIFAEHPSLKEYLGLPLTRCPPEYSAPPSYTASLIPDTTQQKTNPQNPEQHQETTNPFPINPKIIKLHRLLITTFFHTLSPSTSNPPSNPLSSHIPPIPDPHPLVTAYLTSNLLTPDTPSPTGLTPLLAAIAARRLQTVTLLLTAGADPNRFGTVQPTEPGYAAVPLHDKALRRLIKRARRIRARERAGKPYVYQPTTVQTLLAYFAVSRTPLMVAAATGQLPLVRLLLTPTTTNTTNTRREPARDELISPSDGQLALRLAREAGHREIVDLLPKRRGGEWRRWKTHHAVALERVTRAGRKVGRVAVWFVWDLPRFWVWTVPYYVVFRPVGRMGRWLWVHRVAVARWCAEQVRKLPRTVEWVVGEVWKGVKALPGEVWGVMKEIPGLVKKVMKLAWKVISRIPAAMKVLVVWVWEGLKAVGKAAGEVFMRVVSVLHTLVWAVLGWLKGVTLKDVWNGVCDVVDAVVRRLPKAVFGVLRELGPAVGRMLEAMLGLLGDVIWFVVKLLWAVVKYVPKQMGKIVAAVWSSIAKGYHEIMVWIDPKH
ncbi:hypothetical protein B0J18DRAFT_463631 [Chaetomium sp. MPI-SDFR-AT-0129]|nr:hypothetical protein B0J18DRAFT_463631 [Chaetomium sp. MPI-SDFR-AT-0129]